MADTPWTQFMDMHSGGRTKIEPYEYIFIEAPEQQARDYFTARFGRHPNHVTCDCCGSDFSVDEHATLDEATAYERSGWRGNAPTISIEEFAKRDDVLIIRAPLPRVEG